MTLEDLRKTKVGQLAINAHLGAMADPKRQCHIGSESQDRQLASRPSRVGFRVQLISFRHRIIDSHDNLRWGAKPLVDAIAASLGFTDDADPLLCWEYAQIKTEGTEGTIVRIERT